VKSILSVLAAAAVLVLAGACGPTASAIHPTPPLRTLAPQNPGDVSGPVAIQSIVPAGSGTPPPGGIAQRLTGFQQGNAYEVTDVAATPNGMIAVGFTGTGQGYYGLRQGVVWRSADGLTWEQTTDPAFVDVSPANVVPIGDSVYLFGDYETCSEEADECSADDNSGTVVFKSTNGGAWEQLAQTQDITLSSFDGVSAWDNTLVAWGTGNDDNASTTVWTSTDGLTWTATTDLAGLDPVDTVAGGGQGLIAFGEKYDDTIEDSQLVAATSTDGIHFAPVTVPPVTGGSIVDAATGPGGFAGVGYAESDDFSSLAMTVASADGSTWTQTNAPDNSFDNAILNDIHTTPSGYVAVGSTLDDEDMTYQTGRLWASADGKTWRSLGTFGGAFSQYGASAMAPGGLVVFTEDEQDSNDEGTDVNSTLYGWYIPNATLTPAP
jgi:hypothetical protein